MLNHWSVAQAGSNYEKKNWTLLGSWDKFIIGIFFFTKYLGFFGNVDMIQGILYTVVFKSPKMTLPNECPVQAPYFITFAFSGLSFLLFSLSYNIFFGIRSKKLFLAPNPLLFSPIPFFCSGNIFVASFPSDLMPGIHMKKNTRKKAYVCY